MLPSTKQVGQQFKIGPKDVMSSGAEHCVCVTFYTTKDVRIAG